MGLKSTSSPAVARITRIKRKLSRNSPSSRNTSFTPPATPFNNTSFLMQLQQRRRHRHESMTPTAFDQYGSMQTYMSIMARRNHPLVDSSHSTCTSPPHHQAPIAGSPPTPQKTPDSAHGELSVADESRMCGCGPREVNSRSAGGARSASVRSRKLEREEDMIAIAIARVFKHYTSIPIRAVGRGL